MIQDRLVSLCEDRVYLKMETFTNPVRDLIFGLHAHPPFYSPTWLLPTNTSWSIFIGCSYQHNGTWRPIKRSAAALQHHIIKRLVQGHPQSRMMQLTMILCLHSGKFVDLISSFALSNLQFISPFRLISLLPQLFFQVVNIPNLK